MNHLIRLLICLAAGTLFFPLMFGCITVPLKPTPETKVNFYGEKDDSEMWVCGYESPQDFSCVPFTKFMNHYLGLQNPNPESKL